MSKVARLNELEREITALTEELEEKRWAQAQEVVRLLDGEGMSQRQVAAGWLNVSRGVPYSQTHVSFCAKAFRAYPTPPRPAWFEAYEEAKRQPEPVTPYRQAVKAIEADPEPSEAPGEEMKLGEAQQAHEDRQADPYTHIKWRLSQAVSDTGEALKLVRELEITDDEERNLLLNALHTIRDRTATMISGLSGGETVDWDAELRKLGAS